MIDNIIGCKNRDIGVRTGFIAPDETGMHAQGLGGGKVDEIAVADHEVSFRRELGVIEDVLESVRTRLRLAHDFAGHIELKRIRGNPQNRKGNFVFGDDAVAKHDMAIVFEFFK